MAIKVYGLKAYREQLKGIVRDVRVTWLLEELGVPYEHIVLDTTQGENKTPEYLKINPTGKVPTLVDGDFMLFESGAICEYLAEKHQRFIPAAGSKEYYRCKQWNYFALTNVEPHVLRVFSADFILEKSEATSKIRAIAIETLPRFLSVLDQHLASQAYLLGGEFTVSDLLLTTCLTYIKHTNIVSDYPHLKKYLDVCLARPAHQKAAANNGVSLK